MEVENILHDVFNDAAYDILDFLYPISERFLNSCKYNHPYKTKTLLINHLNQDEISEKILNEGLRNACLSNNKIVVELTIEYGAYDFNGGLRYASSNGHYDIVKLMIEYADGFRWPFWCACENGHYAIVKLLIEHGNFMKDIFDEGFIYACKNGHMDIAKLMIKEGVSREGFDNGFKYACDYGHMDIEKLMIKHRGNNFKK